MKELNVNCVIGIDPGRNGGIAIYLDNVVEVRRMPKEVTDLSFWLQELQNSCRPLIFVEKLQMRPNDLTDNRGKIYRIQRMLADYEALKTVLQMSGVPFALTHPMKWQQGLNLRIQGEEKAQRKRRYKDIAKYLFPNIRVTMWNCDALLIMSWGLSTVKANPKWVLANVPETLHDTIL